MLTNGEVIGRIDDAPQLRSNGTMEKYEPKKELKTLIIVKAKRNLTWHGHISLGQLQVAH
jgi:hypothetical protein